MPFVVRNLRLNLDEPEEALLERAAARLRVPADAIRAYAIVRRSLDARHKDDVHFSYQVEVRLDEPLQRERARLARFKPNIVSWLENKDDVEPAPGDMPLAHRPVIVGFGPAGMFAALVLAEAGYAPIVIERGREVRRRHRDVMHRFYRLHEFDPESNLLYGEGGAGTYSDGKLYTRVGDPLARMVLTRFYQFGAPPDILIDAHPHIGSDRLPTICTHIRTHIEDCGGQVLFEQRLSDIRIEDGRLRAIRVNDAWQNVGPVILGVGHSARDTVSMLVGRGVKVVCKPFQLGVRIEHPQSLVDQWQYGACAGHQRLGPAEYFLVAKGAAGDQRDLFSFCMCPGGEILPTNESAGLIATNGASRANRSSAFANSGLVITFDPTALGFDPLEALAFQRRWESLAFDATGQTYEVPMQRAEDFLAGRLSEGMAETSYPLGGRWADIRTLIPAEVAMALEHGLPRLNERMPGYAGSDAIITAPETRASSPIRIVRDRESMEAEGVGGLYPVGEGAGYAGGIVSAAIDGIHAARRIIRRYAQVK